MSLRDSQFGELKVPLTWTAAVALVVAAVVAVALLVTDRRGSLRAEAYDATRGVADTVVAPVGDALSAPGRWIGMGVDAVRGYFFAVSQNRELKTELKEMEQWRQVAIALKNENNRYRSLLGLKTDPPIPMVAARIVSDARGPFSDTRLANTGSEAGVRIGNPVMSENGLVGRIIGVTNGASRVMLLTDAASHLPVMIDRTNARAILTGEGGPNPRLDYLRGQNPVKEGDLVLTSGDGGLMPRGLPVGAAVKGLDGKWRVALASDRGPIDFVRILLFQDFSQIVNRPELEKSEAPPPTPGAETLGPPPAPPPTLAAAAAGAATAAKPGAGAAAPAAGAAKTTDSKAPAPGPKLAGTITPSSKTPAAGASKAEPSAGKAEGKAAAMAAAAKPRSAAHEAAPAAAKPKAAPHEALGAAAKPKPATHAAAATATKPKPATHEAAGAASKPKAAATHEPGTAAAKPKPKPKAKPAAAPEEPPL